MIMLIRFIRCGGHACYFGEHDPDYGDHDHSVGGHNQNCGDMCMIPVSMIVWWKLNGLL